MAYITAQDLQNYEKKVPKEGDTSPQKYCNAAMEMVKDFLGYDPEVKQYTSIVRGDGGSLLELEAFPINSITALKIAGESVDVSLVQVEKKNYICMADDSPFIKGVKYTVTYTAGYAYMQVPEVIRQVALQIAALFWESAGGNLAVSSTSYESSGTRVFNNFQADRFLKQIQMYKKAWG